MSAKGTPGNANYDPYAQTYSYDAWDNLTGRTGVYWNQGEGSEAYTASFDGHNRQPGTPYDAAGNALQGPEGSYKFDAAGRNQEVIAGGTYYTQTRDGDGVAAKRTTSGPAPSPTYPTYYLKSSALGGRIVIASTLAKKYDECAKGVKEVPNPDSAARILQINFIEGVDPTLLAATWAREGGMNNLTPNSDGNEYHVKGQPVYPKNGADVGPMQINWKTWHAWEPVASLSDSSFDNVFGGTTTGSEMFKGDPTSNLWAGARILNHMMKASGGNRAAAAGLYRVGEGYDKVSFEDVTGDRSEDAVVVLTVFTGGSAVYQRVYVYSLEAGRPKPLWAFETGDRADGGLYGVYAEGGELVVELNGKDKVIGENLYGGDDKPGGVCCPKVFTRTRYRWDGGRFIQMGKSQVLPLPKDDSGPTPK